MTTTAQQAGEQITRARFRELTIESADEDGRLNPPTLADWWVQQSLLIGMYMDGLIERRGDGPMWNRGGPWYATGQAILAARASAGSSRGEKA